jgi:hypothetical protein
MTGPVAASTIKITPEWSSSHNQLVFPLQQCTHPLLYSPDLFTYPFTARDIISPAMVSENAINEFKKNDVELTVPPGAPRPTLIIVMVSRVTRRGSHVLGRGQREGGEVKDG